MKKEIKREERKEKKREKKIEEKEGINKIKLRIKILNWTQSNNERCFYYFVHLVFWTPGSVKVQTFPFLNDTVYHYLQPRSHPVMMVHKRLT